MGSLKWIFGAVGWALFGPLGALLGFIVGSVSDSKKTLGTSSTGGSYGGNYRTNTNQSGYTSQNYGRRTSPGGYSYQEQRNSFLISLLVLSAAVMKADGKVLKSELDYVKSYIRANFGEQSLSDALKILQKVLKQNINVPQVCAQIKVNMPISQRRQLFHYLAGIANSDNQFSNDERILLLDIAGYLGISTVEAEGILSMYGSQKEDPYKVLGLDSSATNEEIKKAYKSLVKKYHPDKVATLGEDVRKGAEEKFKKLQEAYDKIKEERGL